MDKGEAGRVEELPAEAEVARDAVDGIAGDRKVDGCQVDADLVRAPGLERYPQQRVPRHELEEVEVRHCLPRRRGVERDAGRVAAVAPDGGLDPPALRERAPADEREVLARQVARTDEPLQATVGLLRARDDEEPRRVAVEAMDDARPLGDVPARDRVREQAVHERAAAVPRAWVDDEPGGLVDDEQVLVLVGNPELELLRLEPALGALCELNPDALAADEPVALRPRRAVHQHLALAHEPLRLAARVDFLEAGEKAVEALAGRRRRHGEVEATTRRQCASSSRGAAAAAARPRRARRGARARLRR